jgi:hypothetical protein
MALTVTAAHRTVLQVRTVVIVDGDLGRVTVPHVAALDDGAATLGDRIAGGHEASLGRRPARARKSCRRPRRRADGERHD